MCMVLQRRHGLLRRLLLVVVAALGLHQVLQACLLLLLPRQWRVQDTRFPACTGRKWQEMLDNFKDYYSMYQ
jgi:hypothetical protein